jgi:hypothetical protein
MATNTTPTTLGSLEFSQIKQSLTDYLKNQSIFAGYNFEGSAIQTMIDLMAYNTFYYAYYANMINAEAFLDSAQKEDSIISLCKPLGYTVPSRTAAKALISVSELSTNNDIPAGTRFTTSNSDGVNYSFYNLDKISVVDGLTDQFYVYEASKYVLFDALPTFDFESQKVTIADENFDISSIEVTITETLDEVTTLEEVWTSVGNVGYTSRVDENIYFIERTSNGFAILFGSENSVGRAIDGNISKIMIRYITTNGAEGNNLSLFRVPSLTGTVTTVISSSGGKTNLDLDLVRFVAPKWFAAQERAVTVNDYKALLLQTGYFGSDKQFNVFGGQDLEPPKYGRVFVTSNLSSTDERVSEIINFLKDKSVITVLPEYITTNALDIYTDFSFRMSAGNNTAQKRTLALSTIKSLFQSNYATNAQFNVEFSASEFISLIRSNTNTIVNSVIISPDDFTIYAQETLIADKEYTFNLENELYLQPYSAVDITEPFNLINSTNQGVLKMYVTASSSKNVKMPLQLWEINASTGVQTQINGDFGYFIANKGIVNIKSNIIEESAILKLIFANKSFKTGLNNLVTFNYNNVTVL